MLRLLLLISVLIALFVLIVLWLAQRHEAEATSAYPPEGQFLEVSGRKVHAVVMGNGPDLVLIHGANGNTRDMTFSLASKLTDRYRIIIFDRPGLGYTDRVSPSFARAFATRGESPAEQAAMLQKAAAMLGADRPMVLGHSYGGAVALAWAVTMPDTLAAVVSVGGVSLPWPGNLDPLYRYVGTSLGGALLSPVLSAFVPDSYVSDTIESIFAPSEAPMGYSDYVGPALSLRSDTIRANSRQVNDLRPYVVEMSKSYPELVLPVELVHGTSDAIVPIDVHARPVSLVLPNAILTEIEGAGHMPHHTHADVVIAAIDRAARRAGFP
jgi:pimeloyl-ACP methyl ester carboxylesterase